MNSKMILKIFPLLNGLIYAMSGLWVLYLLTEDKFFILDGESLFRVFFMMMSIVFCLLSLYRKVIAYDFILVFLFLWCILGLSVFFPIDESKLTLFEKIENYSITIGMTAIYSCMLFLYKRSITISMDA